jgi:hypothetical protein
MNFLPVDEGAAMGSELSWDADNARQCMLPSAIVRFTPIPQA